MNSEGNRARWPNKKGRRRKWRRRRRKWRRRRRKYYTNF
jgi:hypothetical protein